MCGMKIIKRILRFFKNKKPFIVLNYKLMDATITRHIQHTKYKTFVLYIRQIGIFIGYIGLATIPIAIAIVIIWYGVHLAD